MFVLVVLVAAAVIGLLTLAIMAYGLLGQIRRLQRAIAQARTNLKPRLAALTPPPSAGKHRDSD